MAERKMVYSFDVDTSKLSKKSKDIIAEFQKIADFTKKDLGKMELMIKTNINKKDALDQAHQYKSQL